MLPLQSSRLEDQRSSLPSDGGVPVVVLPPAAPTVPDDDFFTLIMRFQAAGRLDDQRSALPTYNNNNNASPNANTGLRLADDDVMLAADGSVLLGADGLPLAPPDGRGGHAQDSLSVHRGSGVVVPSGGLTKAILDRIRNTRSTDTVPAATTDAPAAAAQETNESTANGSGGGGGTKEKLMSRLVKSRK